MQYLRKLSLVLCLLTVLAGCAAGRTAFDKGEKFESAGDLDQAVLKYAEAATANPDIKEYRLRFLKASEQASRQHIDRADNFLAEKKYDDALREYQTAFALDQSQARAKQQMNILVKLRSSNAFVKEGEGFEKGHKNREALRSYQKALEFSPANKEAKEGIERMLKTRKPKLDGYELNLKSTKPITLKFKDAKIKDVFNIITQLSGINFIFDEGVKDTNFSIYLENATFYQALDVITELNKLGKKVLSETTVIIYPKNQEKSKQYEDLYLQTFYLNKIDAKKAVNLLRTMMQIKKIYVNEELNAIIIRDTPAVVELAGKILEANDIPDAEVVLEVEVIELTKSNADNLGFVLSKYAISTQGFNNGTAFSDALSTTTSSSSTTTTAGPSNLLQLFAWRQFSGFLTVPNATFNFAKTLANSETLANPKIRVKNREKAKFNAGTRIPITTTSSPTGGGVSVNVQYVDVGVKLNAEPTIQLNDEISIKLGLEVSTAGAPQTIGGSGSATTVVTIGTRNLDTVLSLKDGETSIIGGLIQDSKSKSSQKISLLGDIPLIGSLFSGHDVKNDKTEIVLAITPHIVRALVVPDPSVTAFWSGKEDEPSTVKLFSSFGQEDETPPAPADAAAPAPARAVPVAPQPASKVTAPASTMPAAPVPAHPQTVVPVKAVPVVPQPGAKVTAPASTMPVVPVPAPPQVVSPAKEVPTSSSESAQTVPAPEAKSPVAGTSPQPPASAVLNITAPQKAKVGDQFRVEVVVSEVTNLYNARFALEFDPALVDVVEVAEGPFLKKDGKPTTFTSKVNKDVGRIDINLGKAGEVSGGSGSGTLAIITFKAKMKGSVNMGFGGADIFAPGGVPMNADLYSTVTEVQ